PRLVNSQSEAAVTAVSSDSVKTTVAMTKRIIMIADPKKMVGLVRSRKASCNLFNIATPRVFDPVYVAPTSSGASIGHVYANLIMLLRLSLRWSSRHNTEEITRCNRFGALLSLCQEWSHSRHCHPSSTIRVRHDVAEIITGAGCAPCVQLSQQPAASGGRCIPHVRSERVSGLLTWMTGDRSLPESSCETESRSGDLWRSDVSR